MDTRGLGIVEKPTWYREYYSLFTRRLNAEYASLNNECEEIERELKRLKEELLDNIGIFSKYCKFNLLGYAGFTLIDPNDKEFIEDSKRLFIHYSRNETVKTQVLKIYSYAKKLEKFNEKIKRLAIVRRCSDLSIRQYNDLLKIYMTKVHEELVLNGNGYVMSPVLGTICISRCKLDNPRKKLNFKATKANKEKILNDGGRLYDKDEAEFCAVNGIDYDGKDYRVYLDKTHVYEIPLLYAKFKNAQSAEFKVADYRGNKIRGKTNEDLNRECEGDNKKVIKLPLDFRTKLNICLQNDKMLYSKFIRNAAQQPIASSKAYRKN